MLEDDFDFTKDIMEDDDVKCLLRTNLSKDLLKKTNYGQVLLLWTPTGLQFNVPNNSM